MDATRTNVESEVTKRRYTGRTRLEAEAGFKCDWSALAARFSLLAEAWDEDTHTLTVFLEPRPSGTPADRS